MAGQVKAAGRRALDGYLRLSFWVLLVIVVLMLAGWLCVEGWAILFYHRLIY
jgi:hypothetical protein